MTPPVGKVIIKIFEDIRIFRLQGLGIVFCITVIMEPTTKRRKTDHSPNENHEAPIDTACLATASTFTLETDELLKEVQVDYDGSFDGAVAVLNELRAAINAIEPHDPIPVREMPCPHSTYL
jgi:hypothetical protein